MTDSKIFVPLLPPLLHLAVVKESINLYNDFQIETLDKAYRRIEIGISITSEDSENYPGCNSAQKKLLRIPPRLRKRVQEAIHGLKSGVELWKKEHSSILELDDEERIFYWRCDGTIDTVKTAQQLILNSNIDIKKRFHLACKYCLEDNIKTLWTEMEDTSKTEIRETADSWVVSYWMRWLRDGSMVTWKHVILSCYSYTNYGDIRMNSFFPSLLPKEREFFLRQLIIVTNDDTRQCRYALTTEEEEKILTSCPDEVLLSYLHWPLRNFFLETAERIWSYFDIYSYKNLLSRLLSNEINREVFDFYDFFECFWNSSPEHLRERVKNYRVLERKLNRVFMKLEEIRRKRKADFDELQHQKTKKISRDIIQMRWI
ncbi:hypothetical protein AVEN_227608-1 [Araneus ventricosus]|uniref:Uncharacterized protein n=1 Tax=Araneus ventricosus TaxID=182803 RepID=A0A4Y2K2T6_ARAVE|nr:hypothetical protein AVEN_227608-1 [Araneus ventricosus]